MTALVRSPARFSGAQASAIAARLPHAPDGSVPQLRLRHVEVDVTAGAG